MLLVMILLVVALDKCSSVPLPNEPESWKTDWFAGGQRSLTETLAQSVNENVAKNVIFFLGDGMGISTVTAGRIYLGQKRRGQTGEETTLAFDGFPHVALSKTYNVDHQVPDSAGTATAFLCGVKANLGTLGVNQNVKRRSCVDTTAENKVNSVLRWSIQEGKRTGIVTTTRVTHATPGASYAHVSDRDWESDGKIPEEHRQQCSDIARQLITENSDINVILGGGRQHFLPNTTSDPEYPTSQNGSRFDGTDLIGLWRSKVGTRTSSFRYVWNQAEFDQVNPESTDFLLGLFEPSHMKFELNRNKANPDEPNLAEMTEKAIKILRRGNNGFFLLVEGGRIDHGHHATLAKHALEELLSFNDAIQRAMDLTDQSDTLIVVTADHSHVFTISGYPSRGNPILGFVDERGRIEQKPTDGWPYVTLSYANGPSMYVGRTNLTGIDPEADNFTQPVTVPMSSETHGGEDVAIYARGPMAHLFHGVQEQNYIPHAMAYASCVGPNKEHCSRKPSSFKQNSAAAQVRSASSIVVWPLLFLASYLILRNIVKPFLNG